MKEIFGSFAFFLLSLAIFSLYLNYDYLNYIESIQKTSCKVKICTTVNNNIVYNNDTWIVTYKIQLKWNHIIYDVNRYMEYKNFTDICEKIIGETDCIVDTQNINNTLMLLSEKQNMDNYIINKMILPSIVLLIIVIITLSSFVCFIYGCNRKYKKMNQNIYNIKMADNEIEFEFNGKHIIFNLNANSNKTIESRHLYAILNKLNPELLIVNKKKTVRSKKEVKVEMDIEAIIKNCQVIIPVMNNYCIGCQELLEFQSNQFATCGKQKCLISTEELLLDNYVVQYFKDNEQVAEFLLMSAFFAMESQRRESVFEPFPKLFLFDEKIELERGKLSSLSISDNKFKTNKNFELIDKIRTRYSVIELINICKKNVSDYDIMNIISEDLYKLLKFILKSNQTSLRPVALFTMLDFSKFMQYQYSNNDKRGKSLEKQLEDFRQFEVSHQAEIEESFQAESKKFGTIFLYHGSSMENWYFIMRNGLKITSGTQLMTTGAAYGNGIYLSSDINISMGYARGENPTFGVYEVINDNSRYTQSGVIFVAKDEKMLLLRYLFVLPTVDFLYTFALRDVMNKKFNISLIKEKKELTIAVNSIKSKRLLAEYKKLSALDSNVEGFYIEIPDENNFYLWNIFLTKFDGSNIEQDMQKLDIKAIQMEVRFPEAYPLEPPFMRIIYPRFQFRTGHITMGGSICMELLTKKGWSSVCSMEALLRDIKANIIEGEGQIDHENYFNKYTIEEAKDAFNRMARTHGWE